MPTSTEPRIEDIPRIAFVTQRFHELQGLTLVVLGAGLILTPVMAHAMYLSNFYVTTPLQAVNFANVLFAPTFALMPRLYRQTFGDVLGTAWQRMAGGMPIFLWAMGSLADIQVQAGRPTPSFAALAVAAYSIWIVAKDWPWRIHHLVPAAAGVTAAVITAGAPPLVDRLGPVDPMRSEAYLLSFTILGLGLVTAGLFDHWLLASSLKPRSTPVSGAARALARTESGGFRAAVAALACLAAGTVLWGVAPKFVPVALPLAIMLGFVASQMALALFQISKAVIRGTPAAAAPPVVTVQAGPDSLVWMFAMALAAALETLIGPGGVALLAVTMGGASVWVAIRDWPYRGHYLIGALASVVAVLAAARVDPARSLTIVVFATSAALTLEGLLDHFVAMRYRRLDGASDHGAVHVDTF